MKYSLIICAAICLIAALASWRESEELSRQRDLSEKLAKEAAEIPGDDSKTRKAAAIPDSRLDRRREDPAMKEKVKALSRDYFALLRDSGEDPAGASGEAFTKAQAAMKARLEELDPAAIRQFMEECSSDPGFDLRVRRDLNNYVRTVFITQYPVEMARMIGTSPELFGITGKAMPEGYVQDPLEHLVYYYSWEKKDIQFVFQCLAELPAEMQSRYISGTLEHYADSAPKRAELLEAMRAFATTPEQDQLVKQQLGELVFGSNGANTTFVQVSDWLASANLSGDELAAATRDMQKKVRVGETGQWLDWLAKSDVPEGISRERAFELADQWTEKDYQAVGKWLNSAPASPEKSAVASAYAARTYPYDPEGAAQWLQTLPQGPDRTRALETIYRNLPAESDAAKAFASAYGLGR